MQNTKTNVKICPSSYNLILLLVIVVPCMAIMGDDELCGRGIYGVFFGTVQHCVKVGNHHQHSHSTFTW